MVRNVLHKRRVNIFEKNCGEIKMKAIIYNFVDLKHFDDVRNVLSSISLKDETFVFESMPEEMTIILSSDNLNTLHKRAMWVIHKVDKKGVLVYKVMKW